MAAAAAHNKFEPEPAAPRHQNLALRERRAIRVAASQGLTLDKIRLQCGGGEACRYDLVDARYSQPAASQLKLIAVEIWLGIHPTTRH